MADRGREMILSELDQYKNDPVIKQHIMKMIDTDIFWYGNTFKAILTELWMIRNGESIAKPSKELREEETHYCGYSHTTFNDKRLYEGRKHNKITKLRKVSVMKVRRRKTGQKMLPDGQKRTLRIIYDVLGEPG